MPTINMYSLSKEDVIYNFRFNSSYQNFHDKMCKWVIERNPELKSDKEKVEYVAGEIVYKFCEDAFHYDSYIRNATGALDKIIEKDEKGYLGIHLESDKVTSSKANGCYIATCVYGSYNCPQVYILRRYRDKMLAKTWLGRVFIILYYKTSPILVKLFGNKTWFKSFWKYNLDKTIKKLQKKGVSDSVYKDVNCQENL